MKATHALALLAFTLPVSAIAGAHSEENIKMHCVILKDGKVVKQQSCVADGYVHAGAGYGGGTGYSFKSIKGYGAISVDLSASVLTDSQGNPLEDENGDTKIESHTTMNDKPAKQRYRMPKTFKLLTPTQEERYYNRELKFEPYTCFIHTKAPKFEFCFSKPLMG